MSAAQIKRWREYWQKLLADHAAEQDRVEETPPRMPELTEEQLDHLAQRPAASKFRKPDDVTRLEKP